MRLTVSKWRTFSNGVQVPILYYVILAIIKVATGLPWSHLFSELAERGWITMPDQPASVQFWEVYKLYDISGSVAWGVLLRQVPMTLALFSVVLFGSCLDITAIQASLPYEVCSCSCCHEGIPRKKIDLSSAIHVEKWSCKLVIDVVRLNRGPADVRLGHRGDSLVGSLLGLHSASLLKIEYAWSCRSLLVHSVLHIIASISFEVHRMAGRAGQGEPLTKSKPVFGHWHRPRLAPEFCGAGDRMITKALVRRLIITPSL
jgi:hypothetical protein